MTPKELRTEVHEDVFERGRVKIVTGAYLDSQGEVSFRGYLYYNDLLLFHAVEQPTRLSVEAQISKAIDALERSLRKAQQRMRDAQ